MKTNIENKISSNARQAFDNYVMWLGWYPCDYAGATEQAGLFIDNTQELDQLESLLREAAWK
tara:strand:+ start:495 stop:680 length:186 start_codon:yes stop_codon:yes gene_type:complete